MVKSILEQKEKRFGYLRLLCEKANSVKAASQRLSRASTSKLAWISHAKKLIFGYAPKDHANTERARAINFLNLNNSCAKP
jgi:hypothetical protein